LCIGCHSVLMTSEKPHSLKYVCSLGVINSKGCCWNQQALWRQAKDVGPRRMLMCLVSARRKLARYQHIFDLKMFSAISVLRSGKKKIVTGTGTRVCQIIHLFHFIYGTLVYNMEVA
jgi:hypothetical protein